ncbi:hypothetical protein [Paracoccus laeviglucosivorans]|uniref:Uncharacterized protein n=1 Tax=Paracoccus laeviglucosivorans TaxID=1197861 RepID=A0A521ED11_9RHOB|nr:hypothetical protein [Paracoccus laeviglucosivorans]SMO81804.1 hypothetical protein SAMN06265221_112104 [Paracoccus laeviglucosivorans]
MCRLLFAIEIFSVACGSRSYVFGLFLGSRAVAILGLPTRRGLADMCAAIADGRPHRGNDTLALHVVEILTSIVDSGQQAKFIDLTTTCTRPDPLTPPLAQALMAAPETPALRPRL